MIFVIGLWTFLRALFLSRRPSLGRAGTPLAGARTLRLENRRGGTRGGGAGPAPEHSARPDAEAGDRAPAADRSRRRPPASPCRRMGARQRDERSQDRPHVPARVNGDGAARPVQGDRDADPLVEPARNPLLEHRHPECGLDPPDRLLQLAPGPSRGTIRAPSRRSGVSPPPGSRGAWRARARPPALRADRCADRQSRARTRPGSGRACPSPCGAPSTPEPAP